MSLVLETGNIGNFNTACIALNRHGATIEVRDKTSHRIVASGVPDAIQRDLKTEGIRITEQALAM